MLSNILKTIKKLNIIVLFFVLFILIGVYAQAKFGERIDKGIIENDNITEASGIAASRKNINVLWTHNDSGDLNRIFALNSHGKNLGEYFIAGAVNRDWEDIAVGPGPEAGKEYIYIADIGDNEAKYDIKYIYRVLEPDVDSMQAPIIDTLQAEKISFRFPDGMRDAETLMVDPLTKDIYIVSKREDSVRVYLAKYPQSTLDIITLNKIAVLNFTLAVGGDISPNGDEILIKNYTNVFYWKKNTGQDFKDVFKNEPDTLPYVFDFSEPLGEAISWAYDASGYYTTNEETGSSQAHLYFYPRLKTTSVKEEQSAVAVNFNLEQNYPNPFSAKGGSAFGGNSTTIKYLIPQTDSPLLGGARGGLVTLKVYDILGNLITTLINKEQPPGNYKVKFSASNLSSGIYFYVLQIGNFSSTKKMLLLR